MAKKITVKNWRPKPETTTPISAEALKDMEQRGADYALSIVTPILDRGHFSIDDSIKHGFKIRGVNFAPNAAEAGPNRGHWYIWMGSGFSASFIDQQITWALQVGANAVTVYLDFYEMLIGTFTQAAYIANLTTTMDKIKAAGLYAQVTLTGWGSGSPAGTWAPITGLTGAGSASDLLPYLKTFTELLDTYANVIAFDIINEANMAWIQTQLGAGVTQRDLLALLLPTIRDATSKPLTASFQLTAVPTSALANDLNLQWINTNLDFLCFHTYYGNNQGPGTGPDPSAADIALIHGLFPGKKIEIGEFGSSKVNANLAANMFAGREIMELPYVIGGFVWSLNAFQPGTVAPSFMFKSDGVEQTSITNVFRTWPRRNRWEQQVLTLGGAGVALPGSLADIPNAVSRIGTQWMDSGQGKDAQYRLVVVSSNGLVSGDHLQFVLADVADAVLQTVDVFAPGSSNPTTPDSGPNGWTGAITGTVTNVAGPTGFTNGLSIATASYVNFGQHTFLGTVRWTHELWIKRTRSGVAEKFFIISGAANSFPHIELAFNTGNQVTAVGGKSGSGTWSLTSTATITDTAWHHVAVDWDGASVLRMYVDGVFQIKTTQAANPPSVAGSATWSASDWTTAIPFIGAVDEIRSSSTPRYGTDAGFTPATSPFSSDGSTLLLVHGDTINPGTVTPEPVVARSPWTYVTQADLGVKLKAANLTGVRGSIGPPAILEVRAA